MKTILKLTIVLIFLSFYNITPAQDSLKIMTYNIQGMKPGTLPGLRLGNIIQKLKDLDPDIIGLQEINETLLNNMPTEKLENSYPNVIDIMLKHKVKLSIGSDAHNLDKIGKFDKIADFVKRFNINE